MWDGQKSAWIDLTVPLVKPGAQVMIEEEL